MDALIRRAQLAPFRTRLSETRAGQADAASDMQSELDQLRAEIERQVRAELASQQQKLCDSERERAHIDGYTDGIAEARMNAGEELAQTQAELKAKMDSALSAMEQAHRAAVSKLQSSVGEVAFAAVCRLLGHQVTWQSFVLNLVEHMCAQLRAESVATARLHPRDINTLADLLQDQELRIRSVGLKLVPDESLELGGCVIEAASGQYDGGLESQLRRLHAVLVGPATAHASATTSASERLQIVKG